MRRGEKRRGEKREYKHTARHAPGGTAPVCKRAVLNDWLDDAVCGTLWGGVQILQCWKQRKTRCARRGIRNYPRTLIKGISSYQLLLKYGKIKIKSINDTYPENPVMGHTAGLFQRYHACQPSVNAGSAALSPSLRFGEYMALAACKRVRLDVHKSTR